MHSLFLSHARLNFPNCDASFPPRLYLLVSKMYPTWQSTTSRYCDLTWCVRLCGNVPYHSWNSSSSTPPTHHIPPGPTYTDLLSSVLMVAAKFHRLTLNSTLVALCYLSVISHVHSCLAKKWRKCSRVFLRVCALLWMIKTSCKVKRKCEMCGWEKDVLLAQCVVKFVIDATF